VILFDNAGVARSSGQTPDTIEDLADDTAAFLGSLGLQQADVLGLSIGGTIAQALTLRHPALVRRLVLVGTAPRAGETEGRHPDVTAVARHEVPALEDFLFLFFEPSETSQLAGKAFWEQRHQRTPTSARPPRRRPPRPSSRRPAAARSPALTWRTSSPPPSPRPATSASPRPSRTDSRHRPGSAVGPLST
jgi:pimeloyl-ACP methyl ester carboxylesterase